MKTETIDLGTMRVQIEHDGRIVTVEGWSTVGEDVTYDSVLWMVHRIANHFYSRATSKNRWGCDGIGYMVEKARGRAYEHISTVGPRVFQQVLTTVRAEYGE